MRSLVMCSLIIAVVVPAVAAVIPVDVMNGTWSGSWAPSADASDSVTIEVKVDNGKISGRFVSPSKADFTKAIFSSQSGVVTLEGVDEKGGKRYKLDGKVDGNRLSGTFNADGKSGKIELVKWTFFG